MRIAFYAPLKPPDHETPSGDREMARLLMRALAAGGHEVRLASRLRSFAHQPGDTARQRRLAQVERQRLCDAWHDPLEWRPRLWFTYHPYYKAPDRLGPELSRRHSIPYVTAEASYAAKRDRDAWASCQAEVVAAVRQAAINFCFTARDREGLARIAGRQGRLADLPPFIDPAEMAGTECALPRREGPLRLVTVAMMRPGDKLESFRMLADALALLGDVRWTLDVIGDGPAKADVMAAFAMLPTHSIAWHGQLPRSAVGAHLAQSDLYVWPGFGEAYGLAYLEAQSLGLPVVAQRIAGVPEVVRDGETGLLTAPSEPRSFADAVRALAQDRARLAAMSVAARRFVHEERSLERAAAVLVSALSALSGQ